MEDAGGWAIPPSRRPVRVDREEFQDWAKRVAQRFAYSLRLIAVGPEDEKLGPPTQMGVFTNARRL